MFTAIFQHSDLIQHVSQSSETFSWCFEYFARPSKHKCIVQNRHGRHHSLEKYVRVSLHINEQYRALTGDCSGVLKPLELPG